MDLSKTKRDYLLSIGLTADEIDDLVQRVDKAARPGAAADYREKDERAGRPWRPLDLLAPDPGPDPIVALILSRGGG